MVLKVLTIPKAAKYCGISRGTFWKYVKEGKIKSSKTPGGKYRIKQEDLHEFMAKMGLMDSPENKSTESKILIVDDDSMIQKLIDQILSLEGYRTEIAVDGFDAGVKMNTFKPDLLILDLVMPGIDGFEVCKRIKSDSKTAHVKIIALTGYYTEEIEKKFKDIGADYCLAKPIDRQQLLQSIERLFSK